jgi:hypothetical protein
MKHSGSREKLFAQTATEAAKNSGSTSLSLSPALPLQQGSTTDKEGETDSEVDHWVRNQQRLRPPPTDERGEPAGSPKTPAGSSSSSSFSSVNKQATARQVAAELIRHGDISLSAPLLSESGNMDNLLPLQVNNDLEGKGQRMPVFTEEQHARLQKSKAERTEPQNVMESSSSVEHASASEHVLSNERKQKELQDLQDGKVSEELRKEWGAKRSKATLEERGAKGGIGEHQRNWKSCLPHSRQKRMSWTWSIA